MAKNVFLCYMLSVIHEEVDLLITAQLQSS